MWRCRLPAFWEGLPAAEPPVRPSAARLFWCRCGPRRCWPFCTWGNGAGSFPYQVAAVVLGAVEGLVGERQKTVGARDVLVGKAGEPDAHRQVERLLPAGGEVPRLDLPTHAFGEHFGAMHGRLGHHDDEFFAAVPGDQVD